MKISLRARLLLGFGVMLAILVGSAASAIVLVGRIDQSSAALNAAAAQQWDAVDIEIATITMRVRVNQWLRSMNPEFARQADDLLAKASVLVDRVVATQREGKPAEIVGTVRRTLTAYTGSWKVIQGLYTDEARLYSERLDGGAGPIRTELARIRDAEDAAGDLAASRLALKAGDAFETAGRAAQRYRTTLKPEEAAGVAQSITEANTAASQAATRASTADAAAALRRVADALGQWRAAFDEAAAVGTARAARLISWTRDEGEALGQSATTLRADGRDSAAAAQAALLEAIATSRAMLYGTAGIALVVGLAFSLILARSITVPLGRVTASLRALAAGDRGIVVAGTERRDEIGDLARAAAVFNQNALVAERANAEQETVKTALVAEQRSSLNRMADTFEANVGGLVQVLAVDAAELTRTAQSLTDAAGQSLREASSVTSSAEAASAGVQMVAAAAEELTSSINEISRQVSESMRMTGQAVAEVQRTDGLVRNLSEAVQKIGDVVGLITSIAAQTNLLALNATIEAARAGDAGKGFAVVASEVKSLATQTGRATEEIGAQIAAIQTATREAVDAIRGITGTIEQISATATSIASAVEQQGAATAEIARNVQATSASTRDVTHTIAAVGNAAGNTGTASSRVLDVATRNAAQAGKLSVEVGRFVAGVRAGAA